MNLTLTGVEDAKKAKEAEPRTSCSSTGVAEEIEEVDEAADPFDDDAGLDPVKAKERFEELRNIYTETIAAEKKHGQKHKKSIAKREELAKIFHGYQTVAAPI